MTDDDNGHGISFVRNRVMADDDKSKHKTLCLFLAMYLRSLSALFRYSARNFTRNHRKQGLRKLFHGVLLSKVVRL